MKGESASIQLVAVFAKCSQKINVDRLFLCYAFSVTAKKECSSLKGGTRNLDSFFLSNRKTTQVWLSIAGIYTASLFPRRLIESSPFLFLSSCFISSEERGRREEKEEKKENCIAIDFATVLANHGDEEKTSVKHYEIKWVAHWPNFG